jgi:DNA-nicking Smr family endonuclease
MKRGHRKKTGVAGRNTRAVAEDSFNTPFAELDKMLGQVQAVPQPANDVAEVPPEEERTSEGQVQVRSEHRCSSEEEVFTEAMMGVEPLSGSEVRVREPGPLTSPSRRPLLEGELEAYAQLVDLVSGEGHFDIQYTDEYMEGAVVGADPKLLPKLRRGDFSIQAHLDLHGTTAEEARRALESFILSSAMQGVRCVLIIHGRGLNSRDQIPIIKHRMSSWLKRGRLKRLVLAFATARSCDGGAGALYVLLRKRTKE